MPELPEVETIKRELSGKVRDRRIIDCTVLRREIIAHPDPAAFCQGITGEKILDVGRKAKYLIFRLSNAKQMVIHLRLSGTISILKPGQLQEKYARLILQLDGCTLSFNEPRLLGRAYLIHGDEIVPSLKGYYEMGSEPISDSFDFKYLKTKLKHRKAIIKSLLLDQRVCAGMGNIYSDEALFRAGIRPTRRANRITDRELRALHRTLIQVIREGIENFGTSVSDYRRTDGTDGNFQKRLYVYGRENEPCRKCGTKIKVKKIGNRGTRYCPKCQR